MACIDDRVTFTRPQILTLTLGFLQVAVGVLEVFPLSDSHHVIQIGTGLLGIALSWRLDLARMYGLALLLCFGGLSMSLEVVTPEGLLHVRTALAGLVITLATPGRSDHP